MDMDLKDFKNNGGYAYVVGTFCIPPRYVRFSGKDPRIWAWTDDLMKAETFETRWQAEAHLNGSMARLVDGNGDVDILKVEIKVSVASAPRKSKEGIS